jgi:pimeloyl-ACP methyl ester carboxylesterase
VSSLADVTTSPIVLVPGFWLGAWAWDDVVAALRADGHDVTAITLPGLESQDADRSEITLSDHVEAICRTVTAKGTPVVLAVHSGAGVPGYAASDRIPDRLAALVYVDSGPAAHALDAAFDATELPLPSWPELEAGGSSLEGLSGEQLAAFRERAVPEPGAALRETPRLADERRLDVPSIVVCASMSSDQIKAAVEAGHPWVGELAGLRDVSYVDLPTGHWPMWSRARELAVILGDVARRSTRRLGGVHALWEIPDLLQDGEHVLDARGHIRKAREPVADPANRSGHADMDTAGPEFLAEDVVGPRSALAPFD